ncbi:metallophosphoesterase family protein [Clostridium intestinale]|uniref:Phosphoesterase, MJ0936 family n=1 Tax=Clostridium intestinale DSM 6191 TaxID=1121320 RepID=A0A1M5ULY8_9CLOT|nr:metallophosphoesterase family protein [Clostridium intestinale]SHH64032.1 phosphoesterase, MJ0936 family [Clostridium intestinale DSM 6191]
MERIAVVADIHANIHALQVFMDHINKECEVSKILNVGDFLQIGPNPVEVFDIVMNDKRFINIMGNNEHVLFNRELMKFPEEEVEHQDWVIHKLGEERMDKLKKLPFKRIINIKNKKILMLHSRINSIIEFPLLYKKKSLEEFIGDYDEDVDYVLIGHTHLPLYATNWSLKNILNPGAFGCGKDGIVKFIIMEIDNELVNITYKQLRYDKQKVVDDFKRNNVPYGEKFCEIFY